MKSNLKKYFKKYNSVQVLIVHESASNDIDSD